MHELFHTEDCGLSLICRCCRGPICERHLARSDRLRIERGLWPVAMQPARAKRARRMFSGIFNLSIFQRFRSAD